MGEIQGITTYLAGLTVLALLVEAVKASIWALIVALTFRRFNIVLVRTTTKKEKRRKMTRGCK